MVVLVVVAVVVVVMLYETWLVLDCALKLFLLLPLTLTHSGDNC